MKERLGDNMKSYLILEDGTVFEGESIGSTRDVVTEIVFNTSLTGYLEILTNPSSARQGIVMTYPLIGNYGVNEKDVESSKPWADCLIVHELAPFASNFRSDISLEEYLYKHDIPGIQGIDTRALTQILRKKGTMNGVLTTNTEFNIDIEIKRAIANKTTNVVKMVSTNEITTLHHEGNYSMALLDYGSKNNIIDSLVKRNCKVTVYPYDTQAKVVLDRNLDGIILSDGPGDPKESMVVLDEVKKLYQSDIPIFAIGLGHQILALATGANTYKLGYGHRGSNQPVKELKTGRSYITSQNHGYTVEKESIREEIANVSFANCNDDTVEGLEYHNKAIVSVQFQPEPSAGPVDTSFLFDRYINMLGGEKNA